MKYLVGIKHIEKGNLYLMNHSGFNTLEQLHSYILTQTLKDSPVKGNFNFDSIDDMYNNGYVDERVNEFEVNNRLTFIFGEKDLVDNHIKGYYSKKLT